MPARPAARRCPCPRCGAPLGAPCRGDNGGEWADHAERIALAAERAGRPVSRRRAPSGYGAPSQMPRIARAKRLPRPFVQSFDCPVCSAPFGEPCVARGVARGPNHSGRVKVARTHIIAACAAPAVIEMWCAGHGPDVGGPGGWAALIPVDDYELLLAGRADVASENRMDLTAALEALAVLTRRCRVVLHTPSAYLAGGFTEGWTRRWQENGWLTSDGRAVHNRDLLELLIAQNDRHRLTWSLVVHPSPLAARRSPLAHSPPRLRSAEPRVMHSACPDRRRAPGRIQHHPLHCADSESPTYLHSDRAVGGLSRKLRRLGHERRRRPCSGHRTSAERPGGPGRS
jgi:ribonuclease HI